MGYEVDPETLRSGAKKITDAVSKADDVKVKELGAAAPEFGHEEAQKAYSELMATWDEALTNTLKKDAEASAEKLESTASNYESAETAADNSFTSPALGPM
ncbi:hypothetical protein E4198_05150 [Streptomyces sp. RKND-216]|uniref:WXG100 family type VII secretion target n=1 Tax=Streptomyces sp. RKND-216 TaxID=2562581 RepID=UPI00109E2B37|nr:hypothetical protein [Streptomyces sp. RKND-216]THA24209.1 hypothetical protein E4198_05150 [Streptomyces sp. RKND-216]